MSIVITEKVWNKTIIFQTEIPFNSLCRLADAITYLKICLNIPIFIFNLYIYRRNFFSSNLLLQINLIQIFILRFHQQRIQHKFESVSISHINVKTLTLRSKEICLLIYGLLNPNIFGTWMISLSLIWSGTSQTKIYLIKCAGNFVNSNDCLSEEWGLCRKTLPSTWSIKPRNMSLMKLLLMKLDLLVGVHLSKMLKESLIYFQKLDIKNSHLVFVYE